MQYLVATDWMWFAVALLMGGAFGYWLPGRIGAGHLQRWGAAAFLIGLAVVALHVYPLRDEPDLEMILLPAFCFAIGGLLGRWLRAAISRAELARAALAGDAQVESAVLGARAKAAVRSVQDAATSTEAKAAGEARLAEATKAAAAKVAAAKAAAAMAAVAKAAEEVRLAAEARTAEQARLAAITKAAEQARLAAEAKAAEEARLAAAVNAAEQERLATEEKAAEEARVAAVAKTAVTETAEEEVLPAADTKAAEEARLAAAVNAVQQERLATEAKAAEQARFAAADKSAEDEAMQGPDVAATTTQAGAVHPGSRPPGIVAPAEGEADDLKRIKGMGPEIEKACNALGIYQFRQIANWTPGETIWVGHHIGFPGRIEREHWIAQARLLGSGAETEHSRAVKSGIVDRKADEPLDPAAAEMLGKSLPEQAAAVEGEDKHPGRRPYGLATPLGKADNLKRIRGIGPQNESRLHGLGIWHVSQIAAWTDENVKWVGSYLGSSGRIQRDNWVAQARDLAAAGKQTESSRRVAAGKVPPPKDDGSLGQDNVQAPK
jgi:predicted flap endonuclease-1-like 5' DNA nuclease